ncbi:Leucine-rich repeat-containing protein 58 [Chionoecetes opilio]|uniref:Leucine-rich repeat-containing protein 58 n=1 Tax=Chionoecetes opilio TaxID=41210 RepID=A0A8J5CN50_CHIOP|nr:Leucine-rich repeat-containing protein 58 [Chionoecetes opilio]
MAANMYYSSESSDSENTTESYSLDFSYLMLDTDSLVVHLRNSIREQHMQQKCALQTSYSRRSVRKSGDGEGDGAEEDPDREGWTDTAHDTVTKKLMVQHNMLLSLPFEITRFSSLVSLDLANNNLTHVNDFLLQLPELQSLYLQNNNLTDDGLPKELCTLTKLRELNLSGNKLTKVLPQLCEIVSLRYLYLGGNQITEILPEIKALQSLQVLHLGGNLLETVPDALGELHQLGALILCDNRLRYLPRVISSLTRLRSLLLHKNDLCCLPVCIVQLRGLAELSLRDNPLVTRFVNSCARDLMYNPPSLLELAARVIKLKKLTYTNQDLPQNLARYLSNGERCVNPKCKGMYFTSCVEHIKFVDFCGMYRVPLMHYLCSSRCSSKTPDYYRAQSSESESEEDEPAARMKRVLLG